MLDLVPFAGSGRIVTNRDSHPGFVAQCLQVQFPGALPIPVAAAAVRRISAASAFRGSDVCHLDATTAGDFQPRIPLSRASRRH
jgi:hypothetical protein